MATVNAVVERGCTMLVHYDKSVSSTEIKDALESGSAHEKAEAMKKAIAILLSGEQMPQIFITIVRFVLPSEDKYVQKLLLLYMEIIEKTDAQGKLLPEMILICQNLRNNLQHPNEFLRGATLRFLCRIQEAEILEPLIPSIIACLEHRHSFVRRNAVMCMDRIYQMPGGDMLLMDAPETIERFLQGGESDLGTRRNAFLMLYNNAQDRAVNFLMSNLEQVANWGDILQNVVLDLIRKVRVVPVLFPRVRSARRAQTSFFQPAVPSRVESLISSTERSGVRSRARGGREGGHGRRVRRSVDRGGRRAVIDGESRAKSAPPPFAAGDQTPPRRGPSARFSTRSEDWTPENISISSSLSTIVAD